MILARGNLGHNWDGKTVHSTATALLNKEIPGKTNRFTILLITVTILFLIGIGHISLNLRISLAREQLAGLRETETALRMENERKALIVHRALKLETLEKVATTKLKMVKPEASQMVVLPEN